MSRILNRNKEVVSIAEKNFYLTIAKVGLVLAIVFAILTIHSSKTDGIKLKAEYLVELTWTDSSTNDMDLWMGLPDGSILSFKKKDHPIATLERDNLGINNSYMDGDRRMNVPTRYEVVTIRTIYPGEYIVNVHLYNKRNRRDDDLTPEKVNVKIKKLNPKLDIVYNKDLILTKYFEELHVTRFEVLANGNITNINNDYPISLVESLAGESNALIKPKGAP